MTHKIIYLPFLCIFFLSHQISLSTSHDESQPKVLNFNLGTNNRTQSAFEFLHNLQGINKGDHKVEGLQKLKQYLAQFGYLNTTNHNSNYTDVFDDHLESAIRTYQRNYHLEPTGNLDPLTVAQMTMPRCGMPDVITHQEDGTPNIANPFIVSRYQFFPGTPRWPANKSNLTYAFLSGFPTQAMDPVSRAFEKWASASNHYFSFSRATNHAEADIKISFQRGDHGDGSAFDGTGGLLAHASWPPDGTLHYDADEKWSVGPVPDAFDVESVALHEIGHLLGLDHSQNEKAIMWTTFYSGITKGLHEDDIQGIRALYNIK